MPPLPRVAVILSLLLLPHLCWGTPEKSASIEIHPVAANPGGAVLFRTVTFSNPYSCYWKTSDWWLGYLVVSADGVWDEVTVASGKGVGFDADPEGEEAQRKHRQEVSGVVSSFLAPLDWENPPASLRPLLEKHGFTRENAVAPHLGKGEVEWRLEGIFRGTEKVSGSPVLRTVFNVFSRQPDPVWTTARKSAPCTFSYQGVALFRNADQAGPYFHLSQGTFIERGVSPSPGGKAQGVPFPGDNWSDGDPIDAIAILPGR